MPSFYICTYTASPVVRTPAEQAQQRIETGLQPKTYIAYTDMFKLFLAFVVSYIHVDNMDTIVLYFEFLAQKNFKACSLRNNVSVFKHFNSLPCSTGL